MSFIKSPSPPPTRAEGVARSLRLIAAQPDYLVAVIAAMMSFGTMSFLMSASPLAIVSRGLPQTEAHWVILLHVLGMFVPSFFTGNLIQRYGVLNIMLVGATMLVTTTYRPAERGKAQALNDFLVFGTTATCSLLAGLLQSRVGWFPLNWQSVVLIVAATLAVAWLWLRGRRPALA